MSKVTHRAIFVCPPFPVSAEHYKFHIVPIAEPWSRATIVADFQPTIFDASLAAILEDMSAQRGFSVISDWEFDFDIECWAVSLEADPDFMLNG
jgi:hypothetical protein